jgi:hypothetical protein
MEIETLTVETVEIEAWQPWEDFTGVFAIDQEKTSMEHGDST